MVVKSSMMKLNPGQKQEYQERHNELWPEMKELLFRAGVKKYYIFLNEQTNELFTYVELNDDNSWDEIPHSAICQKWWKFMNDIMEVNPDNSPVSIDNVKVFELINKE